ncbi:14507_t:CDS:2 [Entrophospora sp. SA101]|nr:14507_t:CDS:2 [Entrophospora sp. SA101]
MSVFSAQSSIKSFVDRKISIDERNTVNKQLLYAFISANVPFSFVENPEVIKLFNTIRPSYKLPSRKTLRIIIFNKYKEIGLDKWIAFASDSGPEFVKSQRLIREFS